MKRSSAFSCAVLLCLALSSGSASAQFGGGGGGKENTEPKKSPGEALQSAIDRAEGMMGTVSTDEGAAKEPRDFCKCVGESSSTVVAKIEAALSAPLRSSGLDFSEVPLAEVINGIQTDYGIPIQLDTPALEEMGLNADEQVTISLQNISLRSALRLMLKRLGLTYVIQDEVLMITTPEQAEKSLRVCVYDIRDFADASQPKTVQALIDVIVSCTATETWASNGGGNGDIRPLPPNLLVISQTPAVHEEIRTLFATIREMRQRPAAARAVPQAEPLKADPAAGGER